MLTFRITNYFLFACLLAINLMHFFTHVSGYWYLALGILYITVISIGSFRVNSGFHFHVYCEGDKSKNGISITFDDGPNPEVTKGVLDVLKKYDARAAFFVIGKKAEANPELLIRIIEEGHVVGNHTYGHSDFFDFFSPKVMEHELRSTHDRIKNIAGISIRWFRPPYGVTNPMMKSALKKTGDIPIGWSLRSMDTTIKDPEKVIKKLSHVKSGDIVLLHDKRKDMPEILERFLQILKEKDIAVIDPQILLGMQAYNDK